MDGLAVELDLHRLELRFAAARIEDAAAVQRLANSIQECGQLVECVAAGEPGDARLVLIDGYRRVAALGRLGRDTAQVQCWSSPVGRRWHRCSHDHARARLPPSRRRCCCAS